ncbi:sensor histidine kinase [Ruminiclostridium cellulolyticum]|uniref:histidine kinase n=1 Tax=Ruminiclostridium cellulolyticum (strain ATCC 35319 / DSM 5812 / JCM 6584 / H10) TaxID=394503 RepID=B8I0K8_RUMCH|nr:sensor histidine kinase [Ruminiclostridium cellulolyticum]ACL75583.1 histidine kinase [Ruminiclostridium cellulolyticum H10]
MKIKKYLGVSLKSKMRALMFIAIIPLLVFVFYLIFQVGTYSDYYNAIYKSISVANDFSQKFKYDYDYSMYQIVIGSSNFQKEGISKKLEDANNKIKYLRNSALMAENKSTTKYMKDYIDSLKRSTEIIKKNMEADGPKYDKNLMILDNDIRTTTTMITDALQKYVYIETFEMNKVHNKIEVERKRNVTFTCIIFAVLLVVTLILAEIISHSITKPIKNLCISTKLVGNGDFTTRVPDSESDEIAMLTTSFNTMIEKIGSLVEDVKLEQINLRKTELKLMQAQINPHFLYNTLDTIIWLAEGNKTKDVVSMVSALSRFFRIALSKGYDYISIKEEEMLIRSYLQIQQYRYQDILEYEINIPEHMEQCSILKLTLQPVVENALYHGIKNKRGMGKIVVEGYCEEDTIWFKVKDNGIGMNQQKVEQIKKLFNRPKEKDAPEQNGFGLFNVNERIKLNFGAEYGLDVKSEYGIGSEFTICIPKITETRYYNI